MSNWWQMAEFYKVILAKTTNHLISFPEICFYFNNINKQIKNAKKGTKLLADISELTLHFQKVTWKQTKIYKPLWRKRLITTFTAWKLSKYGVISGTYFPIFGLNTERYSVSLRIQSISLYSVRIQENTNQNETQCMDTVSHVTSSTSCYVSLTKRNVSPGA